MDGMLTQEEVNRLLSSMCIDDEEVVVKERTLDEAVNNAKRGRVQRHMRSRSAKLSDFLSDVKMETTEESGKKMLNHILIYGAGIAPQRMQTKHQSRRRICQSIQRGILVQHVARNLI